MDFYSKVFIGLIALVAIAAFLMLLRRLSRPTGEQQRSAPPPVRAP
jgi:hypothetical protein